MNKQSNLFTKMGNLTFYNPRRGEFLQGGQSTPEKAQKFFRKTMNKSDFAFTSPNGSSQALSPKDLTQNEDFTRENSGFDPENYIITTTMTGETEPSPTKHQSNIIKLVSHSKLSRITAKSSDKLPTQPHFLQEPNDKISVKVKKEGKKEPQEKNIAKFYRSAQEFQNLRIIDEKDDVAKSKLTEDKLNNVSAHLEAVRRDISYIFTNKRPKVKSPTSSALPEIKEQTSITKFGKSLMDKFPGGQSVLETSFALEKATSAPTVNFLSFSVGPVYPSKLLDSRLQDSRFLGSLSPLVRQRNVLHGSLQKDIHSVQSPLNRNIHTRQKSPDDKPSENSGVLNSGLLAFDTSEDAPYSVLKKELPTLFSNVPSNRQEVLQLGSWLNNSLKAIQENKALEGKEKFFKADEIYNLCLNELIRQVSIDCIERGELLMVVWKAYLNLAEDIIEDIKTREDKAEERGQKECQRVHDMYNEILKTKEGQIEELKQSMNELEAANKTLKEAAETFNEREASKTAEIAKLKEGLTKVKKNYHHLQQEQRDLQYKYQKLKKNFDQFQDQVQDESLEEPMRQATNRQSYESRKNESDYSFSSDSDQGPKEPFKFGNVQHKVITFQDRSVIYEHPNGFGEMEAQTDLILINQKYDKIFVTQQALDNILLEQNAKAKLIKAGEMMENLTEMASPDVLDQLKAYEIAIKELPTEQSEEGIEGTVPTSYDDGTEGQRKGSQEAATALDLQTLDNIDGQSGELSPSRGKEKGKNTKKGGEKARGAAKSKTKIKGTKGKEKVVESKKELPPGNSKEQDSKEEKSGKEIQASEKKEEKGKKIEVKLKIEAKPKVEEKAKMVKDQAKKPKPAKESPVIQEQPKVNTNLDTKGDEEEEQLYNEQPSSKESKYDHEVNTQEKIENSFEEKSQEESKVAVETLGKLYTIGSLAIKTDINLNNEEEMSSEEKKDRKKVEIKISNLQGDSIKTENSQILISDTEPKLEEKDNTEVENKNSDIQPQPVEESIRNIHHSMRPDPRSSRNNTRRKPELKDVGTSARKSVKEQSERLSRDVTFDLVSRGSLGDVFSHDDDSLDDKKKSQDKESRKERRRPAPAIPALGGGSATTNNKEVQKASENQEKRIVHLMNLYKVEKKKQEELSATNQQLETKVNRGQEKINKLEELIKDMQRKLESSKQNEEKMNQIVKDLENKTKADGSLNNSKERITSISSAERMNSKNSEGWRTITKKLLRVKDPVLEPSLSEQHSRGILNLPAASVAARKNFLLEKRRNAGHAIVLRAQKAAQSHAVIASTAIPLKSVLKQITTFYHDKFQAIQDVWFNRDQEMGIFMYKQFLHTYGFQQFAVNKFIKFLASIKKYSNIHRIEMFARIVNMSEPESHYNHNEIRQYILGMEFLVMNNHIGVYYPNPDSEKKHFTPLIRAVEYIRVFGENRMTLEEMIDLKRDIEKEKVYDPTGRNPQGLVDMDMFLERVILKYRAIMDLNKETLKPIFIAGDPLENGCINYIQFAMMYRAIEGYRLDEEKVENMFICYTDVVVNEDIALSFEKFLAVCFDLEIFFEDKQATFLNVSNDVEVEVRFDNLKGRWNQEKSNLSNLLSNKMSLVPRELFKEWQWSVSWIERKLESARDVIDKKAVLLKHRVLCVDIKNVA